MLHREQHVVDGECPSVSTALGMVPCVYQFRHPGAGPSSMPWADRPGNRFVRGAARSLQDDRLEVLEVLEAPVERHQPGSGGHCEGGEIRI